ncbi:MAG: hypothetical protein Q7K42_00895, partial [Candidatus Diapherotrites archaeon]|nr:hypothetical protein [Candidatus Diapherotrites archaeon]
MPVHKPMKSLVERGIAKRVGERFVANWENPNARKLLAKIQVKTRPRSSTGKFGKHMKWTGEALVDAGILMLEANERKKGKKLSKNDVGKMYSEFRNAGHADVSFGQFVTAMNIFRNAATSQQVETILLNHRTIGEWIKHLTPAERESMFANRKKALHEPRVVQSKDFHSEEIERALERGKQFKSFEKALPTANNFVEYKGIKMRSSWEVIYAKMLDRVGRPYIYDPRGFALFDPKTKKRVSYLPDFLEIKNTKNGPIYRWIEVKGALTTVSQRKIELFEKYYLKQDFSGLSEEHAKRMRYEVERIEKEFVEKNKFTNFKLRNTTLSVVGEFHWNPKTRSFVKLRLYPNNELSHGLIPRLAKKLGIEMQSFNVIS